MSSKSIQRMGSAAALRVHIPVMLPQQKTRNSVAGHMTETFDYVDLRNRTQRGGVRFSYSRPEQHWLNRNLIRAVERLSGQRRLERLYREWAANPPEGFA
jgi:hypothetical protein